MKEPSTRYLPSVLRSELGEFPADWRVVPLGDFEPFITSGSRGWAAHYADIGSTFIRITNLSRSCIYPSLKDLRYVAVPPDSSEGVRTALQAGDVLISITADIGIVGLVTDAIDLPAYINQHIALVRFAEQDVHSRYVAYFLAGAAAQRRFKSMTDAGAKAGMNLAGVREVLAALPPSTTEQIAIADALADADALIDSLEQLLTKKRQIKQGAMQELLTGKRRLLLDAPAWRDSTLGQLGRWFGGMTPSMARPDYWAPQDVPWLSSGDIKVSRLMESAKSVSVRAVTDGATTVAPARSLVVVMRSGILRKYFPVAMTLRPMAINQDLKALTPSPEVLPEYLLHALTYFGESILASCLKAGTTVESIEFGWLKQFAIQLPSEQEQKAIAEALTAIDLEIDAIEARLVKSRALKQAMAQFLLTGRIRLVEPTA